MMFVCVYGRRVIMMMMLIGFSIKFRNCINLSATGWKTDYKLDSDLIKCAVDSRVYW